MTLGDIANWIALGINWALIIGIPGALVVAIFYFWRDLSSFLFDAMRYLPRLPGMSASREPGEHDFYDTNWVEGSSADFDDRRRDLEEITKAAPQDSTPEGPFRARKRDSSIIYDVVPMKDGYLVRPIARRAGKSSYKVLKSQFWEMFEPL